MSNFFKLIRIKARNIKRSLRRNLEAIWMCILLLSPFLSLYFERKRYSIIAQLFVIVFVIFLMYLDQYNYNKPSIEGMPIMRKKLAHYEKSTDTLYFLFLIHLKRFLTETASGILPQTFPPQPAYFHTHDPLSYH